MIYDNFAFMRRWTFGEGSGLHPRVTVRANEYRIAWERAIRALDGCYRKANRETPVMWSLTLIGVRLDDKRVSK